MADDYGGEDAFRFDGDDENPFEGDIDFGEENFDDTDMNFGGTDFPMGDEEAKVDIVRMCQNKTRNALIQRCFDA